MHGALLYPGPILLAAGAKHFSELPKKFSKLPYVCLCSLSSKTIERGHVVLWLDQS